MHLHRSITKAWLSPLGCSLCAITCMLNFQGTNYTCLKHKQTGFALHMCLFAAVWSPGRREASILTIAPLLPGLRKHCVNPQPPTPISDGRGHPQARGPPPLAPVVCPLATGHLTHRRKRMELDIARAPDGVPPLETHGGQGPPTCATCDERRRRLTFDQAADQCSNHTIFRVPLLWSARPCHFVVYTIDGIAC